MWHEVYDITFPMTYILPLIPRDKFSYMCEDVWFWAEILNIVFLEMEVLVGIFATK